MRPSGTENTVSILIRPLIFLGFYLALAGLTFRGLNIYFSDGHELRWVAVGLLLAFFILSVWCYWVTRRLWWYPHLYMALQAGLTLGLLLLPPYLDFWAILYSLLSAEAMLLFSQRTGYMREEQFAGDKKAGEWLLLKAERRLVNWLVPQVPPFLET
jgi:hypothetical protein